MNSEDKMREEFEEWAKSQGYEIYIDKSGFYALHETESGWEAWKASRESLVINIEEPSIRGMTSEQHMGAMIACDRIRESIHAAGVKTK